MYYNQYNPCPNCQGQMTSPQTMNPQMANPQVMGTQAAYPQMINPQMVNPVMNQQMMSPQMMNQNMMYMPAVNPVQEMQTEDLRMMYPKSYYLIMAHVKHHCDMMENKHGAMYNPTRRELEEIKDDIYNCVDKALDDCDDDDKHNRFAYADDCIDEEADRRPRYDRRNAVRDLIGVALIGELLGRRPFVPYPPYAPYYPYPPVYGYGYGGFY